MATITPATHRTEQGRSGGSTVVTRPRIRRVGDVRLTSGILVGVDGSVASLNALRWALHEGMTRGAEVHVVYCWDMQPLHGFPVVPLDDGAEADREAGSIVLKAMSTVRSLTSKRPPASPVRIDIIEGRPASVLMEQAVDGQLLVVGSRGQGGFAGLVLGSVSQQCLAHARTPVVVVHDSGAGHEQPAHSRSDRGIVVGVDGSENSVMALRWALDEGILRGVPVHVACVWTMPVVVGTSASRLPGMADLRADARATLDAIMNAVTSSQGPRAATSPVSAAVVEGRSATEMLTAAADGAGLLVLGSRGRGGFVGLLLGSVSAQCAAHARCPVVVVHDGQHLLVRGTHAQSSAAA